MQIGAQGEGIKQQLEGLLATTTITAAARELSVSKASLVNKIISVGIREKRPMPYIKEPLELRHSLDAVRGNPKRWQEWMKANPLYAEELEEPIESCTDGFLDLWAAVGVKSLQEVGKGDPDAKDFLESGMLEIIQQLGCETTMLYNRDGYARKRQNHRHRLGKNREKTRQVTDRCGKANHNDHDDLGDGAAS